MSVSFEFEVQPRESTGKSAARRLRFEEKVPAIVYGAGKEPMPITLSHKTVIKALDNEAVYSHILTLKHKTNAEKVVLKALMRHPTKPRILHMDFMRISASEKMTMRVPLHFLGEAKAPGLKDEGGVLSKLIAHLDVSCLPADLPEFIEVDISAMAIGDSIHLSQIKLPHGVALVHAIIDEEHDHAVVSIHQPRVEVEEEPIDITPVETVITGQKPVEADEASAEDSKSKSDK